VVGDSGKSHGAPPRTPLGPWTVEAADAPNPVLADSVLRWLALRGFDARVVGRFPYRVRVGHFASKHDAMAVARRLLRPGWTPFVTEARE
jgi:SPOR domain